jgi:dTDP-4-amino-4,6-dideoxygalactose transaminase
MGIKILDVVSENVKILEELEDMFVRIVSHGQFILGSEVEECEKAIANLCGVDYAVGVSSGTDALVASFMALGIKEGDEVITTPYSFFATVGAIVRLGAKPVFVDIDPKTFNMDVSQVEGAITDRTRVILPIHLFGQCCDMSALDRISSLYGISIVEDACQSLGANQDLRFSGSFGLCGCFSFFPSKNLGGLGDGGMVVTKDPSFYDLLRKIRNHGSSPKYYHPLVGGNFRLDTLQAGFLLVKLKYFKAWTERRRQLASIYDFELKDVIGVPNVFPGNYHVYNQYMVLSGQRDGLKEYLKRKGVETALYYPKCLHLQECLGYLGYKEGDFPNSERLSKESLALPLYPQLEEKEVMKVCLAIQEYVNLSSYKKEHEKK